MFYISYRYAGVVKLVYTLDSKSNFFGSVGSSPTTRTTSKKIKILHQDPRGNPIHPIQRVVGGARGVSGGRLSDEH